MPGSRWPLLLLSALALSPRVALGEYKLRPGDVLDVLIAGVPDFRQHVPVGAEGEIGLPLAGQVKVGDLSVAEARGKVAGELANKLYRQYTSDGREISHLILGSEVVVMVSEYTPVFVNGDVVKPGEYVFRPGMTVRQAIAVAGGFETVRSQGPDPVAATSELQTEYQTLRLEIAGEQARSWRLRTELGDKNVGGTDGKLPRPAGVTAEFMKGETEQLQARITRSRRAAKRCFNKRSRRPLSNSPSWPKKGEGRGRQPSGSGGLQNRQRFVPEGLAQITRLQKPGARPCYRRSSFCKLLLKPPT